MTPAPVDPPQRQRRETAIWLLLILLAILTGLCVVLGAVSAAMGNRSVPLLNYGVARFKVANYGAEADEALELHPLDAALAEEAAAEDAARQDLNFDSAPFVL